MKKLIPTLSLCFLLSVFGQQVRAQNNAAESDFGWESSYAIDPEKLSFGFNISPTVSWLNIVHSDLSTDGATLTAGIGFNVEYSVDKLISVASGINIGILGGYVFDNASMDDPASKNNFLLNFYNMEIPVMLKIKTVPAQNISYYAQGGLTPGFRLGSRELHKASSWEYDDSSESFNHLSNPLMLGYVIGIGVKKDINKHYSVFGEINFKNSILNMSSRDGYNRSGRYPADPVPEIYNGNMAFSFGVMF